MSRYAPARASFGPGPMTPAVRAIVFANIAVFILTLLFPAPVIDWFGLTPALVVEHGRIWQLGTYLFVHDPGSISHILFNMLMVWMFGVELERRWGTRRFTIYYFITGVGAGLSTLLVSLLPVDAVRHMYVIPTIGASGAVFGLILAWAVLFPSRTILFMMIFPMTARVFGLLMGAIELYYTATMSGGPVASVAHLGGLVVGWLYLKGPTNLRLEMIYRMTKWRMERMRRRFNVHKGGRDNWGNRIH